MKTTLLTFGGILVVVLLLLFGMKYMNNSGPVTDQPNPQPQVSNTPALPVPPVAFLNNLYAKADFIDYIFYESNFSMSVAEEPSVKSTVSYLSQNPVYDLNCTKSMGKIFYKSQGETIQEADFYFSPNCSYYVLLGPNRQPAYACGMTEEGYASFSRFIGQILAGQQ